MPKATESCIVIEGITGAWRLGPGALATFGAKYTKSQFRLLYSRFKKIFILFDPDEAGETNSARLRDELRVMGRTPILLDVIQEKKKPLKGEDTDSELDSGKLSQDEADTLMKEVLR